MAEFTFRAPVRSSDRGGGGHLVDASPRWSRRLAGRDVSPSPRRSTAFPTGSIVRMGGGAVLGVQQAIMAEAGVWVGDSLTVVVRNDEAPREVEVPATSPRRSLGTTRHARRSRASRSHTSASTSRDHEAKRPETRARRIERTIEPLIDRASRRLGLARPFAQNFHHGRFGCAFATRSPSCSWCRSSPSSLRCSSWTPCRGATAPRRPNSLMRPGYALTDVDRRTRSTRA